MQRALLFSLISLSILLSCCQPSEEGFTNCPGSFPDAEFVYGIPTTYFNSSSSTHWAFVSDADGNPLQESEVFWGSSSSLLQEDYCTEDLDLTMVKVRQQNTTDIISITLKTITKAASGVETSPWSESYAYGAYVIGQGSTIHLHNIPDDLTRFDFPRYLEQGNAVLSIDQQNAIATLEIPSNLYADDTWYLLSKRSSESFYRAMVVDISSIPAGNVFDVDYADFTILCSEETIVLPSELMWDYRLLGHHSDFPKQPFLIKNRAVGDNQATNTISAIIPGGDNIIGFTTNISENNQKWRFSTEAFPSQIEFDIAEIDGTWNGQMCTISNNSEYNLAKGKWRFQYLHNGKQVQVFWEVFFDPASTTAYTLPGLPSGLLTRIPALGGLGDPIGFSLFGRKFSGSPSYQNLVYQYFNSNNGINSLWQENIGYQEVYRVW